MEFKRPGSVTVGEDHIVFSSSALVSEIIFLVWNVNGYFTEILIEIIKRLFERFVMLLFFHQKWMILFITPWLDAVNTIVITEDYDFKQSIGCRKIIFKEGINVMEMFLRPVKKYGNNRGVSFKDSIFLEFSLKCSLEIKEEVSCHPTRQRERETWKKKWDCLIWRCREVNKM